MSKPAAFLLALVLGASACSTAEPEQSIVAIGEPSADAPSSAVDPGETGESSEAETEERTTPTTGAPAETPVPESTNPSTEKAVEELLAFTVDPDAQHASARFSGAIAMSGNLEGEDVNFEMNLSGAYNLNTRSMEMTVDMSSMASMYGFSDPDGPEAELFGDIFAEPLQMKSIGDTAWMKWGLLDMFSGSEGKWIETPAEDENLSGGAVSPAEILDLLRGASGEVTDLGTETIRGVETTHFQMVLDLEDYAQGLSVEEAAEVQAMAGEVGAMPLDVWVDADGLLRRLEMTMSADSISGAMGPTDEFEGSMWYELYEYGSNIEITPPPADQVVSGSEIGTF